MTLALTVVAAPITTGMTAAANSPHSSPGTRLRNGVNEKASHHPHQTLTRPTRSSLGWDRRINSA
jgi:hypothetical protein